ncbi:hypothetical protein [Sulfitobacter mediterraneus]|uniref:Lipoprotein n=1 Tax=Sulfitobacter mediterraneus TaxID=83219 RepID=A0A061SS69_9RHOB|nr:hypothetical protein [Sulfitobacter mediterraneus]KAJ02224.1 hypothetical protein PM02_14750 [Sulfitobacter mediterraneus]
MTRYFAGLALVALLAGCAADTSPDSPIEAVQAAAYQAPGPKTLTVFTMVNNRTGSGGHTALMVNGSQRVIFDPAGSFRDPRVTERGDVLYGVTPGWLQAYKSAHARSTYHVVSQEFVVTPEQAEKALRLVQANGAVPGAFCANATTGILSQIDGFEGVKQTFYPVKLMEQIETFPGVRTTRLYENDAGDVIDAVKAGQLAQ